MTRRINGRDVTATLRLQCDAVVVGSGPAGAAAARVLSRGGLDVAVVEAGRWFEPEDYPSSAFDAMASFYREMSTSVVLGPAPIPLVQGKMVGGSSPINGAICWRMPHDVHQQWLAADAALADALPWDDLERVTDAIEARLGVAPTDPAVAFPKSQLMARGADALGIEHRPIRRNVVDCEGLGRCLQGCPKGRKRSVDVTLLADAEAAGARVLSSAEVESVTTYRGRAVGVVGRAAGGGKVIIDADSVVLAASAVQTPALLLRSGIDHGPVGYHFQCHPGVSLAGHFPQPVRMWEGATQGHEVIGLRSEGLKFETLGFGLAILAARLPGVGRELAHHIAEMAHHLDWGAAIKAEGEGRVRVVAGRTVVSWSPTPNDIARFRRGLRVMGEMMLAAGADHVLPGVRGFTPSTSSVDDLVHLEERGPTNPAAFTTAITHMFGTCRMGSDPDASVVRPDFRHHQIDQLYVADSSVFPSNLGVNPQVPIMALAELCAQRVLERQPPRSRRTALTLDDLMRMDTAALEGVMHRGHPLDPEVLAGRMYLGVDLSLPEVARKLLWHTFRKTFVRDGHAVRGWNVRMQQTGIDGPRVPLTDRRGRPITFGHYRLERATGIAFPGGYRCAHYLDYGVAGNALLDPARFGYTPLVAVNAGSQDLLLGWEVFKVGPRLLPMPLYWALRYEGPLDEVVEPPR